MNVSSERSTLRLNVSCHSRDKKFLVLGEKDSTITDFITAINEMFKKLYPDEATLQVSGIKNQSGFDICFDYKLGDLFDDNACLNVIESGSRLKQGDEYSSSGFHEDQDKKCDEGEVVKGTSKDLEVSSTDITLAKQEESVRKKQNDNEVERRQSCLSSPDNKRSHSESAEEPEKRKKRRKNVKKKKPKQ